MTTSQTKVISFKRILFVWALALVITVLILMYGFLLWQVTANTAERGRLEQELPGLAADVSQLEFRYLSLRHQLNEEQLADQNLVVVNEAEFIETRTLGQQVPGSVRQ